MVAAFPEWWGRSALRDEMGVGGEWRLHFWDKRLHAGNSAPSHVSAAAVAGQDDGGRKKLQPLVEAGCEQNLTVRKPANT